MIYNAYTIVNTMPIMLSSMHGVFGEVLSGPATHNARRSVYIFDIYIYIYIQYVIINMNIYV